MADITTVILAGGLGTRLRSVVGDRPKVLAEVRGRPFLAYLLDQLTAADIREAVLCTGYLGDRVQMAFGETYGPIRLLYSQEPSPKGTAGALRLALPLLKSDPVLVMNGDSYCHADLKAFWDWHRGKGAQASMLLVERVETERFGRVRFDRLGRVNEFVEKEGQGGPGWISAGIYLIHRSLLQTIPANGAVSLEREIFPSWIGRGLFAYCCGGSFLDMGTPEAYAKGESFFNKAHSKEMPPEELDAEPFSDMAKTHLFESAEIKRRTAEDCVDAIIRAANLIEETLRAGGKILLCGNGGSAADCQHMAAEFVSRLTKDFDRQGLPAIALTTDTSFLTAYANDCGFDGVFERQVETLGRPGDTLLGISTSGNSANVIRAVETARRAGMHTVVLTGGGGSLTGMADVPVSIPSDDTQYVQETHLAVEHILCGLVERALFRKENV